MSTTKNRPAHLIWISVWIAAVAAAAHSFVSVAVCSWWFIWFNSKCWMLPYNKSSWCFQLEHYMKKLLHSTSIISHFVVLVRKRIHLVICVFKQNELIIVRHGNQKWIWIWIHNPLEKNGANLCYQYFVYIISIKKIGNIHGYLCMLFWRQ